MSNMFSDQLIEQVLVNVTNPDMFGCTVSRKAVTKTLDNSTGDADYTEGTATDINVYFTPFQTEEELYKEGEVVNVNAFMMTRATQEVNRDDIIIFQEQRYRIEQVTPRYIAGNLVAKDCKLTLLGDV